MVWCGVLRCGDCGVGNKLLTEWFGLMEKGSDGSNGSENVVRCGVVWCGVVCCGVMNELLSTE